MRTNRRRQSLAPLLRDARLEVLPTPTAEQIVVDNIAVGRTITVTASPNRGLEATLDFAERLAGQGYHAVPHLAARMVSGRSELGDISERLVAAGIDTIFVPAGDADPIAGDYSSAVDLLEDLKAIGSPFSRVGVTGYPESHPMIGDDITVQSMWDKRRYATDIVSNMCFDPAALRTWIARIRKRGITMPLIVGLPGPVERAKLLAMATKIGVGESTRFLTKNKSAVAKIASPGYSPERFLDKTAATLTAPESLVTGLHLFTFNQVAEVERWRARLLAAEDPSLVS